MTTLQEMIAVMQAFAEGKTIEVSCEGGADLWDEARAPNWAWDRYEYRIKRVPREMWLNVYSESDVTIHESRTHADEGAYRTRTECIHVREVID